MPIPPRVRLVVMVLLCVAATGPLGAQAPAPGRWGCRVDSLSGFNCAQYYTGTVTLESELRGPSLRRTSRIVATITGGRVSCRVTDGDEAFEGPGMIVVEHKASQVVGGEYEINVWCPDAADSRPRRGDSPGITIMNQRAADYGILEGRDSYDHPDADTANGLSGRETVAWTLRR